MKKLFALLVVMSFSVVVFEAQAQVCRLLRDSVILGQRVSTINNYQYVNNQLSEVNHIDSGSISVNKNYILFYSNNDLVEIRAIDVNVGGSVLSDRTYYDYTAGKISRITVIAGDTSWYLRHNVSYDGNGNIQHIVMDSVLGNPKGIPASFTDITWSGGNLTGLNLVFMGDTLEMNVTSVDDKNNVFKHMLNTEGASYLFQAAGVNNIEEVVLENEEAVMGDTFPAGTPVINNSFTYAGNEVETMAQGQSLFSDKPQTIQFIYDCTVGISTPVAATAISVYPNPAASSIQLKNENFRGDVKIFDITGKVVMSARLNTAASSLDIRSLQPGVYSIEMTEQNNVFKGKFVKN